MDVSTAEKNKIYQALATQTELVSGINVVFSLFVELVDGKKSRSTEVKSSHKVKAHFVSLSFLSFSLVAKPEEPFLNFSL